MIHLAAIERYAEIFPSATAETYSMIWWRWASTHLDRQLYEEVRKLRWEKAGRLERLVAKECVPK